MTLDCVRAEVSMMTFFVLLILCPWGCPGITSGVAPFLAFRPLSIDLRQTPHSSYFISPQCFVAAFSALLVLSDSRSFMRALCS